MEVPIVYLSGIPDTAPSGLKKIERMDNPGAGPSGHNHLDRFLRDNRLHSVDLQEYGIFTYKLEPFLTKLISRNAPRFPSMVDPTARYDLVGIITFDAPMPRNPHYTGYHVSSTLFRKYQEDIVPPRPATVLVDLHAMGLFTADLEKIQTAVEEIPGLPEKEKYDIKWSIEIRDAEPGDGHVQSYTVTFPLTKYCGVPPG